ncbi:hypothetical protein ABE10_00935, partial [Bacillus toyonensis]|nr:hypothetical protein [Bacillus toyonensis]
RQHLAGQVGDGRLELLCPLGGDAFPSQVRRRRLAFAALSRLPPSRQHLRGVGPFPGENLGDVRDPLAQRLRIDPVGLVVRDLLLASTLGLLDRVAHRVGHVVGVHVHLARDVPRGTSDRLDQRGPGAEEAFFVGVQDRHQRDLRQVEPLAEQVDADEHVVDAGPQFGQELHPAQRVDIGMQITDLDPVLAEEVRQLFRHLLRQRRHQHALVALHTQTDLLEEVIDLALRGLHDDLGVDEPCGTDDLLHDAVGDPHLVLARRCREVDGLTDPPGELVPAQRAVVHRARQPEAVVDQCPLARGVALVHRPDLRHCHMGLIDDEQEVVGEEVEQRVGRLAGLAAVEMSGVVLDPRAEAELLQHLEVERRAHAQTLRLEQLPLTFQLGQAFGELGLDRPDGALDHVRARDVVRGGEDRHGVESGDHLAGEGVQRVERLDLIPEELDPDRVLLIDRDDLDRVAPDPEVATREVHVVAVVLHRDELPDEGVAVIPLADLQRHHRAKVLLRGSEAVDAGHRRDHDDISPAEQRVRRRVAQALHLGVDRGVLLDEGVGLRDVCLGLVVVVIRDEVLDRV